MGSVSRKKAVLPKAWVEIDGQYVREAQEALVMAILEAWQIKQDIEAREADYKECIDEIKSMIGAPCSVVVEGVCRAIYSRPETVKIIKPETLVAILGERYDDLVKETASYKPTDALIELASDADDPLAPAVRAALKISVGESLKLLPEAAKEAA